MALALVVLWLLLWGDLSVANVLSGAAVAVVLLVVFPLGTDRDQTDRFAIHPVAVVRLLATFVGQVLWSNVLLTRSILTPDAGLRTAVVVCPLASRSNRVMTLTANLLALTPGIMPVDVTTDPSSISVHVLLATPDEVRRNVAHLEALVIAAVGERDASPAAGEAAR